MEHIPSPHGDPPAHAEAPQRPVESRARSPSWKLPSNPPPQKDLPGPTWPGEQALSAVSSPEVSDLRKVLGKIIEIG